MYNNFVHLHCHTQYSLLDGTIRIPELARRVAELGQPAVAITDHGSMGGIYKFYKACKEADIKPLIGVEAYTTDNLDENIEEQQKFRDNYHMVLIAKNQNGYQELLELSSQAHIQNYYYKPRISIPKLLNDFAGNGNLIASSACLGGHISKLLKFNEDETKIIDGEEAAFEMLKLYRDNFHDNFFAEVQENGENRQEPYNWFLIAAADLLDIPLIVTTDAHYLKKEDHKLHSLIMAMQFKQSLDQYLSTSKMVYGTEFYIKSYDEMKKITDKYNIPEALDNTVRISEMCNVEIEPDGMKVPTFDFQSAEDYQDFLKWKRGEE